MKGTAILAILLTVSAIKASVIGDALSSVVARIPKLMLVPDGDWKLVLIDINNFVDIGPSFNASEDTYFYLYTRNNSKDGQIISANADVLAASNFNKNFPTRVIIHGYLNNRKSPVNTDITAAYLKKGDYNVIVVDWGRGAIAPSYVSARYRIPSVADETSKLLNFLIANGLASSDRIIIVGHSLGAHCAGLTAKRIQGPKVSAVIGLDPAGPLFDLEPVEDRIDASDAEYVQIIHTNGGLLGMHDPLGDADFYPNYGRIQTGCEIDPTGTLSHNRSPTLFAESINSDKLIARKCVSFDNVKRFWCIVETAGHKMGGEPLDTSLNGIYYFSTNYWAPYGKG